MRRVIVIIGVILIVLGVLLIGANLLTSSQSVGVPAGAERELVPSIVTSGTLTISWSGASPLTAVTVYDCGSACTPNQNPVGSGSGASGSISFSISPGHVYGIVQSGNVGGLTITANESAITYGMLIGIALAIIGLLLAIVGWRARAKLPAPAPEAPPAAAPEASEPAAASEDVTAPPADAAPAAGPGGRPPIQCGHCKTWNEPWLTNCRWCKRPLGTTGGG